MDRLRNYKDCGNLIPVVFKKERIQVHNQNLLKRIFLFARLSVLPVVFAFLSVHGKLNAQNIRTDILLNSNWKTVAFDKDQPNSNFYQPAVNEQNWKLVNVPHNWDGYEGYRRLLHGNRHGVAWYRKTFAIKQPDAGKRFFLFFEGVGSYANVYLNGKFAGAHAGGRTTFTIDITGLIKKDGSGNQLTVQARHPAQIKDLPWVCGGCSDERGFSEGSQPMGIFRPVHLIVTNDIRVEPFGVHAWSDIGHDNATLNINTSFKNYAATNRKIEIVSQLADAAGKIITTASSLQEIKANDAVIVVQKNIPVSNPLLWSVQHPYLYTIITLIKENGKLLDKTETIFGFRTIHWKSNSHQFFINGKPEFINGIAEYEHLLGESHAFSDEQIMARIKWLKAAGFNALRDAHQPHNLLYGHLCDREGILWWSQLSAHIWYDSPAFRNNFKQALKEWVIERRNDPALILWGLQNESKLPEDFAKECTALIRELDPTASAQRLVTTCNGGSGTDWDVPQNWTGTYGGDPNTYAEDIKKQVLIGEYGAWRTLGLHTEGGFVQNGPLSEDRMTSLMEEKIRLAESVRDSCAGQFFWLLTSHDNPGRVQGGEGLRELDRIGPVNYKGMLTPWEEPTDAFYMFRSNYTPAQKEPMVYIVSHTWPGRWMKPGIKDSIIVYSNCDEVELFNDINGASLGRKKKAGVGTHFQWNGVNIQFNVLFAVGYLNGKIIARDTIVLNHLPPSPHFSLLHATATNITKPAAGYQYIYRVNCGGPDYKDQYGNTWLADRALPANDLDYVIKRDITSNKTSLFRNQKISHQPSALSWGSSSWAADFPGVPDFFASQRSTCSPIKGTTDWQLFRDFRYGRDKLSYQFGLPDGEYLVALYFIEPWLGIGGGMDAAKMRLFDVAINGKIVLKDLDIWKEAGTNIPLKKTVQVTVRGGRMIVSFPHNKVGQAIIAAIAIASKNYKPGQPLQADALDKYISCKQCTVQSWLDIGQKQYTDAGITFNALPANLYGADWLQFSKSAVADSFYFIAGKNLDVYAAYKKGIALPSWLTPYENTQTEIITDEQGGTSYTVYRKRFSANTTVSLIAGENCILAYLPVTHMQPAYDLKPVTAYRTNVAIAGDGVNKETLAGRECTVVKTNQSATIEWPVQTGVGDVYSITLKYYWPVEKELKAAVQLLQAGGTMMLEAPVNLTFTKPGKWNTVTCNTGTMINAGNYTVKLIVEDGKELALSGIEIQ